MEAIGISHGSVVSILKDHLGMKNLSARWMPRGRVSGRNMDTPQHARDQQWVLPGESAPKKANVGLSANKVMATVFWDARIMHISMGRTINGE